MSVIYYNGNIITMDQNQTIVSAIMIKDGIIQKCGNDDLLLYRDENTKCIDLKHKTMLPGFIDAHSHFAGLANSLMECDLSDAHSFQVIVDKMKRFKDDHQVPEGHWIIGSNYDHNFLKEKKHPDKKILDQISTHHPIVIIHASSHMGVASSLALLTQNITGGQHYGYYENSNELDGYMEEDAFIEFRNHMPMVDSDQLMKMFVKAQDIYASYGITTIQEGMVTKPLLELLKYASLKQLLQLDLIGYIDLENARDELLKNKEYQDYINHLRIGGYKIFLDGSPQGKTAWMLEPYNDGSYGYPAMSDQELYTLIVQSLQDQQQLLAHCNGDAACQQYITQFQKVLQDYPELKSHRSVMIHSQFVTRKQLEQMQTISLIPSFFVAHVYHWGDIHIQNVGYKRASHISPAQTALKLGIPFTFHQDSPVIPPHMLETIDCAVNRQTLLGRVLGEDEKIDVYHALQAVTSHAAYQYFEEDKKGTIEVGKLADLVILSENPLMADKHHIKDIQVLETIKEGKTIYKKS